ncbi:MAG TPA: hypothetical protein VHU40_22410 [Polyangia bacterium]|nr:hypothetical protein [Polyangia bacterium]
MTRSAWFFLVSMTAAGGCARKSSAGYEPVFRADFPGEGCKDLKVETGTYDTLCSRSPAWKAACPLGWKDVEGAQMAIMHGMYEGPLCQLSHDDCDRPEKVDFVGAAIKIGDGNWDAAGLLVIGDRRIDVRATLEAGCRKSAKPPG